MRRREGSLASRAGHGTHPLQLLRVAEKMIRSAREIRIQIDSRLEFIDLVQQAADDISRAAGFGREATFNVGLAVREAVVNAIKHGNHLEEGKRVRIVFRIDRDRLVVVVRDEGEGFDFDRVGDPLAGRNIFKSCGRGIFFMKSFVDRVTFSRARGGGTEVLMEKRLQKSRRSRQAAGNP